MKLSHLTLSILLATSLIGATNVEASSKKRPVVKVLTKNKQDIQNPYYKMKLASIEELSDEESLMYELDLKSSDKALILSSAVRSNKIKIPGGVPGGVPGSEDGGIIQDSTTAVDKGGLSLGTGAGGTINPGMGKVSSVLDGVLMIVDKLVAIGEKIIPTIEKGRPVVSNKAMQAISVLPRIEASDPVVHDMADWSIPVTKHYKIVYSNGFGATAVSFVYSVTFQYNGTYGGKGKYLAGVRMSARDIMVNWGFDLDATSQLIQISNVGTQNEVIAGATLEITYTVKNVMRNLTTSESFHVTGAGRIYKLD